MYASLRDGVNSSQAPACAAALTSHAPSTRSPQVDAHGFTHLLRSSGWLLDVLGIECHLDQRWPKQSIVQKIVNVSNKLLNVLIYYNLKTLR